MCVFSRVLQSLATLSSVLISPLLSSPLLSSPLLSSPLPHHTTPTTPIHCTGAAAEPLKEFVPRNSRACNAVAWNRNMPTQLAAGLDKVRSDFSTLIWDITQSVSSFPSPLPSPLPSSSCVTCCCFSSFSSSSLSLCSLSSVSSFDGSSFLLFLRSAFCVSLSSPLSALFPFLLSPYLVRFLCLLAVLSLCLAILDLLFTFIYPSHTHSTLSSSLLTASVSGAMFSPPPHSLLC
jgi:MIOS, WD40 repeat